MKRSPLKRTGKKSNLDRAELALSKGEVLARSAGHCEAHDFSPHCTRVGTVLHHVKRRSQGGGNEPENLLWLCVPCHDAIHQNPELARKAGYLKASWEA